MIDVSSISQIHIGECAPILVLAMGLEDDISPEDECRGSLLGIVAEGLALLWAVDATEADTFRMGVVQDFDGVTVEDGDNGASEVGKSRRTG
jgi:hypothetical protein